MIQSVCKAFNNMDLDLYLDILFSEVCNNTDKCRPLTILHVCSSHFIKAAIKRIRNFTSDLQLQILCRSAVGLLIHVTDLEKALDLLTFFFIL